MYSVLGKHFIITKKCCEGNLRDELLSFFNRDWRPINIALSADVKVLPKKEVERVLFMHPHNLADAISEKMNRNEIESASLSFDPATRVIDVCMGRSVEVQLYLNEKEYGIRG